MREFSQRLFVLCATIRISWPLLSGRGWRYAFILASARSFFLSFSIACTLIYVLVMNFIRNVISKAFAHCMRSTHTAKMLQRANDFCLILLLFCCGCCSCCWFCRCVRSLFFQHIYHFSLAIWIPFNWILHGEYRIKRWFIVNLNVRCARVCVRTRAQLYLLSTSARLNV